MRRYFFIDHTTDIRLKLEASTLEELFLAALEGMGKLIKHDLQPVDAEVSEDLTVTSSDPASLLIDFLSGVLTQSHIQQVVFTRFDDFFVEDNTLSVTVCGYSVTSFDEDSKAVTYHEAYVEKTALGTYEAQVIFDI